MSCSKYMLMVLLLLVFCSMSAATQINLTAAEHLDAGKVFLYDIYPEVRYYDGILTANILMGQYARVYFEDELTDDHHIIVYARARGAGDTYIEVFVGNTSVKVADSPPLTNTVQQYIIELDSMGNITSDYFDLRTSNSINNSAAYIRYEFITDPVIELYGVNLTNITQHGRFNASAAQSNPTEGGNITGVEVSSAQLTEKWAAFYGQVLGQIYLRDNASSNYVYSWDWTPNNQSVVCVSTNPSIDSVSVFGANSSDIDSAWNFVPATADSANNTFNQTDCNLTVGSSVVENASYADTGSAGGFRTCAIRSSPSPVKSQLIFCSQTIPGGTAWDGGTADYELMVPTNTTPGSTENYYFYANLN